MIYSYEKVLFKRYNMPLFYQDKDSQVFPHLIPNDILRLYTLFHEEDYPVLIV
jgi:hypothetical protein